MYGLCFAVVLLAPAAMLLVGLMWKISPPPYRSKGLAYSTELTQRDPDAWKLAHRHCARLWLRIGLISGVASTALLFSSEKTMMLFGYGLLWDRWRCSAYQCL